MERRPGYNYNDPNASKRDKTKTQGGPIRFPEIAGSGIEEELFDWPRKELKNAP